MSKTVSMAQTYHLLARQSLHLKNQAKGLACLKHIRRVLGNSTSANDLSLKCYVWLIELA